MELTSNEKFSEFWKLYPNKKGKGSARKKYFKYERMHYVIMNALRKQIDVFDFNEDSRIWQPQWKYPTTWLNGECWSDDVEEPETLGLNKYINEQVLRWQQNMSGLKFDSLPEKRREEKKAFWTKQYEDKE